MTEPKFATGQRVRIADRTPPVHHRVPSYAKGQIGVIERVCGVHGMPELWNAYDGADADLLEIVIFEHLLEPAE